MPTEAENCDVNGRMLQNLLDATAAEKSVRHVALVTGLKHYLGPFEAYAKAQPDTPFSEDQARLPYENFYYVQEDILFAAAERDGFTWSVHRPHTLIGWALGNAMNMGVTLAVYAAICRETGRGFHFPGSREQWEAVTDVTDAGLLADHLVWAATTPAAANQALNIVNGDVFRWRRLWPRLAAALGVEPVPFDGEPAPLEQQMADAGEIWPEIVRRHGLRDLSVESLASWWHTDADLGRTVETFTDMGRSRRLGFLGVRDTRVVVHRSLRAPAGRADRAVTGASRGERRRCGRFASTPRATSGSRRCAEPPAPGAGEVVVRVVTCGICGTDLHEYVAGPIVTPVEPHPLTGAQNPQILGHEFAGDVVAIGPGVTSVARGRSRRDHAARVLRSLRVLPARAPASVRDDGAASGSPTPGAGWRSSRRSRSIRSCDSPTGVTYRQGALIEPTAVAAYGVERAGVGPGDRVLVTGAGPIGALAALCARSAGASTVYISEPNPARRARAEALGVATVLDPTSVDVPELPPRADATGSASTWRSSARGIRTASRQRSARSAGAARSRRRACSSARRPSSRCSGRSTT